MNQKSTIIAYAPNAGLVRACPSGCVHVAYRGVTLDFTSGGFEDFAAALERDLSIPESGEVSLECFHVTLRFTGEEYREFVALVREGEKYLALWENQQRHEAKVRPQTLSHPLCAPEEAFSSN